MIFGKENKCLIHKRKIDKLDLIKIKFFSSLKDSLKKMKNKNYQLGESISNPTSNKVRLVSRINNSPNRRLKKYPIRKLAKYMIDISPKRIYRWQIST